MNVIFSKLDTVVYFCNMPHIRFYFYLMGNFIATGEECEAFFKVSLPVFAWIVSAL